MIYPSIVVGAGAAGLFFCAENTGGGLILEKTHRPGRKLLLTGSGQCNVTHGGSIKDFPSCYGIGGPKIRSCLYKYSNLSLMEFLQKNGIKLFIREDGKVFPQSMNAGDILDILLKRARDNGFSLQCDAEVTGIRQRTGGGWEVSTPKGSFACERLILAGGGCSYPKTGSDGSLLRTMQRDLQIRTVPLRPALSPVFVSDYPYRGLSGIALENVHLRVFRGGRKTAEGVGSLLFTHTNLSGPLILDLSKEITKNDELVLNYLYPCDKVRALDKINNAVKHSRMNLQNTLSKELNLPKSFLNILVGKSGPSLKALTSLLTEDRFSVQSVGGFEKAMVTSGGVDLSELSLKTMEFRKYPGLYAVGELLDVDGRTGGYNLQFAYSSAMAASRAAQTNG